MLIENALKGELKDHCDWEGLLTNVSIGVLSLGTAFIANTIYSKGEHTFFKGNTDPLNKEYNAESLPELITSEDPEKKEGNGVSGNASPGL